VAARGAGAAGRARAASGETAWPQPFNADHFQVGRIFRAELFTVLLIGCLEPFQQ
jgi:hypothetical protein